MENESKDIRVGTLALKLCDCGLLLVFTLPEYQEMFREVAEKSPDLRVVILSGTSNPCPDCGKVYIHPPAEAFEPIRQPFGDFLSEIANRYNKE